MKTIKFLLLFIFLLIYFSLSSGFRNQIDEQKMKNLVAFTKLYGYIKYFHPSDEAYEVDWNKFAIYGVQKVENAKNSDELIDILNDLFLPIAPSVQISNQLKMLSLIYQKYFRLIPRV